MIINYHYIASSQPCPYRMRRIGSQCFKETVELYKGYLQRRACRLEYPNSNVSEISNIDHINSLLAPNPTEVWLKKVANQTTGV